MTDAALPPAVRDEALRLLGVPKEPPAQLLDGLSKAYSKLLESARPRSLWQIFDITVYEKEIDIGGIRLRGEPFAELCRGLSRAVLTAATLGAETDRLISRTQKTDMAEAVLLDACASAEAERLICAAQDEAFAAAGPGCRPTMRFSPGYGETEPASSAALIEALSADKRIGLSMTASGLLVPIKSITAITGIADGPRAAAAGCGTCAAREGCKYRKRGTFCGERA